VLKKNKEKSVALTTAATATTGCCDQNTMMVIYLFHFAAKLHIIV